MEAIKVKLSVIVARLIVWALFGSPGPGERTVDQALAECKKMLNLLPIRDQYEIIRGLVSWRYPGRHIHANPQRNNNPQPTV